MSLRRSFIIIDDHPLYRHGVRDLIVQELRLSCAGEAGSIEEALPLMDRTKPDLAIIDISLQGKNGLDLVRQIKLSWPGTTILVVSMHEEGLYGERALSAGARGYVMKHEMPAVLIGAVRTVLEGRLAVSTALSERMLEAMVGGRRSADSVESLSDRELEVFRMIGKGTGAMEIAATLGLSIKTVNAYRDHIKEKLKLPTAAQLRKFAIEWTIKSENQSIPG